MRRREFLGVLGGAAVWPLAARAQQATALVVGLLNSGSFAANASNVTAFRQGLKEAGFIEGQNVAIEYRWADNQYDRLPDLVADLINRRAAVIIGNTVAALRAKAATPTVPIVFTTGSDPVRDGLVASFNRPGGNVTGVVFITGVLGAKRLELLRQLVPRVTIVGMLSGPRTTEMEAERDDVQAAAQAMGLDLVTADVDKVHDIEASFASLVARGAGALAIGTGAFTFNNREQIVALAARHAMPVMYSAREYVVAGGLITYGASLPDAYREAGLYAARILKGEKPADLPVMRSNKFELVINLKTAKSLGLEVPDRMLVAADEVIE